MLKCVLFPPDFTFTLQNFKKAPNVEVLPQYAQKIFSNIQKIYILSVNLNLVLIAHLNAPIAHCIFIVRICQLQFKRTNAVGSHFKARGS